MKSFSDFHKDENGVAYLIIYIILALLIFGGVYAIFSDLRDIIAPIFTDLGILGNEYNDADTAWGWNFINFLFSFSITFFVLALIHFAFTMSQKPEMPYQ